MPTILNQGSYCPRPRDPTGFVAALIDELADPACILDASFEAFGNFITPDPISCYTGQPLYPPGHVYFFGNFLSHSGVFNLVTNASETIAALTVAIRAHQQTDRYLAQWHHQMLRAGYTFHKSAWRAPDGAILTHEQESRLHRPGAVRLSAHDEALVADPATTPATPSYQLPLL